MLLSEVESYLGSILINGRTHVFKINLTVEFSIYRLTHLRIQYPKDFLFSNFYINYFDDARMFSLTSELRGNFFK